MDLSLSEEQRSFRTLAREFLDKEVVPHRAAWDRAESVDPGTVPKAVDVLTPDGVSQATELDPTAGPVTIAGVPVPGSPVPGS